VNICNGFASIFGMLFCVTCQLSQLEQKANGAEAAGLWLWSTSSLKWKSLLFRTYPVISIQAPGDCESQRGVVSAEK
jgi:hypothetical protein